jgi:two-component system chemotaxis response regulator CheY
MTAKILIVEDDNSNRTGLIQLLNRAGYDAIGAATFEKGRELLKAENPDLLITDLRLEAFNGLQLIITRLKPIPTIVITGFADRVLETEAKHLGAAYLVKPFLPSALLDLIEERLRATTSSEEERRWLRKPVGGLPAQIDSSKARVIEVSYGGLRLELDDESTLPASFDVMLPTADVAVHVDLVWQHRTDRGRWVCGAALSQPDPATATVWHGFVDAIA